MRGFIRSLLRCSCRFQENYRHSLTKKTYSPERQDRCLRHFHQCTVGCRRTVRRASNTPECLGRCWDKRDCQKNCLDRGRTRTPRRENYCRWCPVLRRGEPRLREWVQEEICDALRSPLPLRRCWDGFWLDLLHAWPNKCWKLSRRKEWRVRPSVVLYQAHLRRYKGLNTACGAPASSAVVDNPHARERFEHAQLSNTLTLQLNSCLLLATRQ